MEKHWLVRPDTVRRLWIAMIVLLALVVLAQILWHVHGEFGIDESFGFHAWYGLATCTALVLIARALGFVLKRKDTYYD